MSYPKSEGTARPYRLWNAKEKKACRWRCYSDPTRACNGALIEVYHYAKLGTSLEVYNAGTGRRIRTYTSVIRNGKAGVMSDKEIDRG